MREVAGNTRELVTQLGIKARPAGKAENLNAIYEGIF
jgi:hypothetical protein